jgi:hypothetical protein
MTDTDGHTFKEINGLMFEQPISQLEDRPHLGRNRAKFISQAVNQLIHVVEQI